MFGERRHLEVVGVREVSYRATRPGIRMKRLALHQTPPPGQAYELVISKMAIRAGEASSALPTLTNAASERVKGHLTQRALSHHQLLALRTDCLLVLAHLWESIAHIASLPGGTLDVVSYVLVGYDGLTRLAGQPRTTKA